MLKKLFNLKMAAAALFVGLGVSAVSAPANAQCWNNVDGRFLVCVYYVDNEWVVLVGDALQR